MDHTISCILFDVGGVLVALDGVPPMAKLLGLEPEHEELHELWLASPSVIAHETGKISAEAFAVGVVSDLNLPTTAENFLLNFCDWPTGLLPGALQLLEEVPDTYQIAALSNTSAIHWEKIRKMGIVDHFHKTYLSHQIGCLKPSAEAFLAAVEGMRISPSEILFLDDGLRNIDAASKLGMQAHLARGPGEARCVLEKYGIVHTHSGA